MSSVRVNAGHVERVLYCVPSQLGCLVIIKMRAEF